MPGEVEHAIHGTLKLEESFCAHHIASPNVHVDDKRREIRMYYQRYHRPGPEVEVGGFQARSRSIPVDKGVPPC